MVIDPAEDLFRWKVAAYPAFLMAFCYGMANRQGWPKSELVFLDGDCYWWNNWADIDTQGRLALTRHASLKTGDFQAAYYRRYRQIFSVLDQEFSNLDKLNLSGLPQSDFRRVWLKFFKTFLLFSQVVIIPEVLAYYTGRELERRITRRKYALSPEEISRLTVFPERSFLREEEYELLKIALEGKKKTREERLVAHARQYAWLLNGYHGVRKLDKNFFARRLKELGGPAERARQVAALKNYSAYRRREFQALVKKYRLDPLTIALAKLAQRGSYLQDDRKRKQLQAMFYIDRLYRELARRLEISPRLAWYMNYMEFDRFMNKRLNRSELLKRQIGYRLTLAWSRLKFSTRNVRQFQRFLEEAYAGGRSSEVRGIVAQPGRVKGLVKIIRTAKDIMNFPAGRILVAQMTSPDYIVAIKKAKAIVTDDGGLTCHAAIVARELKIPCIVGTRNATRRLKDGFAVAVDADQGVVKIN